MTERLTPNGGEYTFVPEDWDNHTQDDDCPWKEGPENLGNKAQLIREHVETSEHTSGVLARFLASPDRTPLRRFKRGDVFRIDRFSHEAVVRFTQESFVFEQPTGQNDPYQNSDCWGVVSALSSGKVVLMKYYVEFADPAFIFPGLMYRRDRIVPEVTLHARHQTGIQDRDVLIRYRDLVLYSAGKTAPEVEKQRARFRLPDFGTIFRRPIPQPA